MPPDVTAVHDLKDNVLSVRPGEPLKLEGQPVYLSHCGPENPELTDSGTEGRQCLQLLLLRFATGPIRSAADAVALLASAVTPAPPAPRLPKTSDLPAYAPPLPSSP